MPADLRRSAVRDGVPAGKSRTLPVAVALTVLVILAAGIGGTADFTGARWFPHLHASIGSQTETILTPTTPTPSGARHGKPQPGTIPTWLLIVLIVVLAAAIVAAGLYLWNRRRLPAAPQPRAASMPATKAAEPEPEPEPERLLTGIELALQALDEQREPGDAIVRAWIGLQETAEQSGIFRGPAETPTEFTSRILSRAFADDRALRTLLRLYLRTRFGDHPVTEREVTEVRAALRQLVSSWQAGAK